MEMYSLLIKVRAAILPSSRPTAAKAIASHSSASVANLIVSMANYFRIRCASYTSVIFLHNSALLLRLFTPCAVEKSFPDTHRCERTLRAAFQSLIRFTSGI